MVYGNFDTSYAITQSAYLGINSYALGQFTLDKTNGQTVAHSRETEFSIGPGGRYVFDEWNAINVNLYLPVVSQNATSGLQFNTQFVTVLTDPAQQAAGAFHSLSGPRLAVQ